MKRKIVVLKLGGSAITNKNIPFKANINLIRSLAKEISKTRTIPLVIIHGGGSFGHPIAKRYKIDQGLKENSQLIGFSKTHEAMLILNRIIIESLLEDKFPALGMSPSSQIVTRNGKIKVFMDEPLRQSLKIGLTPVLYGDAVLDITQGFSILSGDQIAATIAVKMGASRLIMGIDVDGLYTNDPKTDPSAKLFTKIKLDRLEKIQECMSERSSFDVTGGMCGKINELIEPVSKGIETLIVNALKPRNIYKSIIGEKVYGTRIEL